MFEVSTGGSAFGELAFMTSRGEIHGSGEDVVEKDENQQQLCNENLTEFIKILAGFRTSSPSTLRATDTDSAFRFLLYLTLSASFCIFWRIPVDRETFCGQGPYPIRENLPKNRELIAPLLKPLLGNLHFNPNEIA